VGARVQFPADAQVSDSARGEIERTLTRIADAVSAVPPASSFWDSMKSSVLQLDAGGCHVVYRIEPEAREIRVIELQETPPLR